MDEDKEEQDRKPNQLYVLTTEGHITFDWDEEAGDAWKMQASGYLQVRQNGKNSRFNERFFVAVVERYVEPLPEEPDLMPKPEMVINVTEAPPGYGMLPPNFMKTRGGY